jgi:hypothetical protein
LRRHSSSTADGERWRIRPEQWRKAFSPEHAFFGGAFIGNPPYGGLYPFILEAVFKKWLAPTQPSRRGRKAKYPPAEFRKMALKVIKDMGLSFSQSVFKARMQELCQDSWGQVPRNTWLKKHMALALKEHERG